MNENDQSNGGWEKETTFMFSPPWGTGGQHIAAIEVFLSGSFNITIQVNF